MPICTTCTASVEYLYTLYETKNNLRLKECPKCLSFADPYVEYDTLTLLLDLILLKRGVYRHLLFNRGWPPENHGESSESLRSKRVKFVNGRERARWKTVGMLGLTLVSIDTFPLSNLDEGYMWDDDARWTFLKIFIGCMIGRTDIFDWLDVRSDGQKETTTFHIGVLLSSTFIRRLLKFRRQEPSSIVKESKPSHIPLTLFYSSFTKLFLLLCLSIWRPENAPTPNAEHARYTNLPILNDLLNLLDEDKLDRHWIVRNVIGGMAAGFGLRGTFTLKKIDLVALDCHPSLTALIIMVGWTFKAWVSHFASQWLGITEDAEWMAYSIP